jgi:hypothetical protein
MRGKEHARQAPPIDDETWQAIDAVLSRDGLTFQELTDDAFRTCSRSTSSRWA